MTVLDHPLAYNALAEMRSKVTNTLEFRRATKALTQFVVYEATRSSVTRMMKIETPLCETDVPVLDRSPVIVGVWRAGQIMVDVAVEMFPDASAGYLGMFRNEETFEPEFYYENIGEVANKDVLLVDPMLATGGSAILAIEKLLASGANIETISLLCLIASAEGVSNVHKAHPEVRVVAGALDEKLNDNAYIVPGLGDAGDRINNT